LHIVAAGAADGVPPFDQMITAPSDAMLTAPMFTAGQHLAINRAVPFDVAWTSDPSPVGQVSIFLGGPTIAGMPATSMTCTYPISAASASIPASTLQMIAAGSGMIAVSTEAPFSIIARGYVVELNASSSANTANGAPSASLADFN